jgi:hypothetical protein
MKTSLLGWFLSWSTAAALLAPSPVLADPLTYIEVLDDPLDAVIAGFDLARDLRRVRVLPDGTVLLEEDDATLAAEHSISPNFGLSTDTAITYSHFFTPAPAPDTFLLASLTIAAFDVNGFFFGIGFPNDPVQVEGPFVGFLNPGGPGIETLTTFATTNDTLISLALADNRIDVAITPAPSLGTFPDFLAVRSSIFAVQYQVPEPATLVLMATGLAALAGCRRRRRYPSTTAASPHRA